MEEDEEEAVRFVVIVAYRPSHLLIWRTSNIASRVVHVIACSWSRPILLLKPYPSHPENGREIDYTAEAANAQRFVELYGGLPDIFVPRVYTELSTRKVIHTKNMWADACGRQNLWSVCLFSGPREEGQYICAR